MTPAISRPRPRISWRRRNEVQRHVGGLAEGDSARRKLEITGNTENILRFARRRFLVSPCLQSAPCELLCLKRIAASQCISQGSAMPFYQKGDVRIRYEETGSGFPLLVTPGGGLNSRVSNWPTAVFNAMEVFKDDFRCITMDQRNAIGGEFNRADRRRRSVGRVRRRSARPDGPSRHQAVLLHGLLHRRLLRAEADGACA